MTRSLHEKISSLPYRLRARLEERILGKVTIGRAGGCWVWNASRNADGYGCTYACGMYIGAHRASFAMFRGEVPAGKEIDHLCRNRACINPKHLEPVSHRVNVLRGDGPAAKNFRRDRCKHGHKYTAETCQIGYKGERLCLICIAARYERYRSKLKLNRKRV